MNGARVGGLYLSSVCITNFGTHLTLCIAGTQKFHPSRIVVKAAKICVSQEGNLSQEGHSFHWGKCAYFYCPDLDASKFVGTLRCFVRSKYSRIGHDICIMYFRPYDFPMNFEIFIEGGGG